jgi:hypothetical protein
VLENSTTAITISLRFACFRKRRLPLSHNACALNWRGKRCRCTTLHDHCGTAKVYPHFACELIVNKHP